MCRAIKTLHNFSPPATADEIHASSLQFVRKLSGFTKPSKANEEAFNRAVDEVVHAAHRLLESLVTNAPPRNREVSDVEGESTIGRPSGPPTRGYYHRVPYGPPDRWSWDLQGDERRYLGGIPLVGKRVLEIGPANGGLTFWMTKEGASVVSVDLGPDPEATPWDLLVRPGDDERELMLGMSLGQRALNDNWRYGREYYAGDAQLVTATAYDIPREVGEFDVLVYASVLLHLRDPLRALEHGLSFVRDTVVITDVVPTLLPKEDWERPVAHLVPYPSVRTPHGGITWWHLSPKLVEHYLELRGFRIVRREIGEFRHFSRNVELFTIVATRT